MIEKTQDNNQNFWHLTCIQAASLGVPGIIFSKTLANYYGAEAIIFSIFIANLILWLIAFAIISMSFKERRNAIENAEDYIGKFGARIAAFVSIMVFPIWYVMQLQATSESINTALYGNSVGDKLITTFYASILGVLIAVLAFGKAIRIIKKLNTIFLPILIFYYLYAVLSSEDIFFPKKIVFSVPCIFSYVSFLFAGAVNLPTFFKHARSKYDCYLSLTFLTIIVIFFQICSLWMSSDVLLGTFFKTPLKSSYFLSFTFKMLNIAFAVLLLICSNLVNIYFSYPSWELIFRKIKNHYEFFLIGIAGTIIYILTRIFPKTVTVIDSFQSMSDDFTANLGVSLLLIFLVRIIVTHRPKPFEKLISTSAWIIGCAITVYASFQNDPTPLLSGIGATILFFVIVFFIEEPFWCTKKLKIWLKKHSD